MSCMYNDIVCDGKKLKRQASSILFLKYKYISQEYIDCSRIRFLIVIHAFSGAPFTYRFRGTTESNANAYKLNVILSPVVHRNWEKEFWRLQSAEDDNDQRCPGQRERRFSAGSCATLPREAYTEAWRTAGALFASHYHSTAQKVSRTLASC